MAVGGAIYDPLGLSARGRSGGMVEWWGGGAVLVGDSVGDSAGVFFGIVYGVLCVVVVGVSVVALVG